MDADEYIAKQALGQLHDMKLKKYACFLPFCGAIRIYCSREEFNNLVIETQKNLSEKKLNFEINPIVFSFYHEYYHLYHILGSSASVLIQFCSFLQWIFTTKFISNNSFFQNQINYFRRHKNYFKEYDRNMVSFLQLQKIRNIAGDQCFDFASFKIKDFITPISKLIEIFEDYIRKTFNQDLTGKHLMLFRDLAGYAETEKNIVPFVTDSIENYENNFQNLNYSEDKYGLKIAELSIIEGYARTCQALMVLNIKIDEGVDIKALSERYGKLFNKKDLLAVHYIETIFNKKLKIDNYKKILDVHFISLFIFELSIQIPLNPYILMYEPTLKVDEIFITKRFRKIVDFLVDNFDSYFYQILEGYRANNGKKLIEFFDDISSNLGWVKYTKTLEYSLLWNENKNWGNNEIKNISSEIINKKLEGIFSPIEIMEKTFHEISSMIFIFNECTHTIIKNKNHNDYIIRIYSEITKELFSKVMFYSDNFEKLTETLTEFFGDQKIADVFIAGVLKTNNIEQMLKYIYREN